MSTNLDVNGLPISGGGLGNYATIMDSNGVGTNISQSAYDSIMSNGGFEGTGFSAKPMEDTSNSMFGISNDIFDLGLGLGQLGLGYMAYKDNKELNKAKIAGMNQNLENAKTESAATAAYRKSYGA